MQEWSTRANIELSEHGAIHACWQPEQRMEIDQTKAHLLGQVLEVEVVVRQHQVVVHGCQLEVSSQVEKRRVVPCLVVGLERGLSWEEGQAVKEADLVQTKMAAEEMQHTHHSQRTQSMRENVMGRTSFNYATYVHVFTKKSFFLYTCANTRIPIYKQTQLYRYLWWSSWRWSRWRN